jgi:glycerol uptake facilitator-like aquaporin
VPSRTLISTLSAELVGTFLFIAVGGAAVISDAQTGGAVGLVGISLTFGLVIAALATAFGPISGAHFNPAVSLVMYATKNLSLKETLAYIPAQIGGAIVGALLANLTFDLPVLQFSDNARVTTGTLVAEVIATAGLLAVIQVFVARKNANHVAIAVAAWIGSAYFFTASTSFANPAVTIGRAFTDTFAGIAPASIVPFIAAQLVGAALGLAIAKALTSTKAD